MLTEIGYLLTALGFGLLGAGLLVFGGRSLQTRLFAAAALLHALWAMSLTSAAIPYKTPLALFLQLAYVGGWALFFASLFPDRRSGLPSLIFRLVPALVILKLGLLAAAPFAPGAMVNLIGQGLFLADLAVIILGLAVVIGVFQASGESERWVLKFLVFPLGLLFAYDLFLYAQSLSSGAPPRAYIDTRSLLNLISMPLIIVAAKRHKFWTRTFTVSRQAALYSLTLIGVGIYLILAALAAYAVRNVSPDIASQLQTGLLFGAVLLLLFLLASGSVRAKIKDFMRRHFYAHKYDYAHEWREFMYTLARDEGQTPLPNRIIRACADLLEIPGGSLWSIDDGAPNFEASWNMRISSQMIAAFDPALLFDAEGRPRCLSGDGLKALNLPEGLDIWLVVPLPLGNRLSGFLLLASPRIRQSFDREDEDLILLVARQCASFLSESKAVSTIEQDRQFARFNRQYAFVAHDVKNILSQLTVMLKNFERHAANPEFQRDMFTTIGNTVDRLQKLMQRLSRLAEGGGSADETTDVALTPLLRDIIERRQKSLDNGLRLKVALPDREIVMHSSPERLSAVIDHLLSNALEASGSGGSVRVGVASRDGRVIIDIEDDGQGMTSDFIRDRLFTPFKSTKIAGFGVGAYQCREFAREHGGDLDVVSSPGAGTIMRLILPIGAKDN